MAKLSYGSYRKLDWSLLMWPYSVYKHCERHSGLYTVWQKHCQAGGTAFNQESSLPLLLLHLNNVHIHRPHTARPVSSLNTHRHTVTHKGQAIKISKCHPLCGWWLCYYGNTVTNRARVLVCACIKEQKPSRGQSVTMAAMFKIQLNFTFSARI